MGRLLPSRRFPSLYCSSQQVSEVWTPARASYVSVRRAWRGVAWRGWPASRERNNSHLFTFSLHPGFLGSSVAGAITREFGALAMSITSTARKAMTLFLSFILFPKVCTIQHVIGIAIFISSLSIKAIFASSSSGRGHHRQGKSLPA